MEDKQDFQKWLNYYLKKQLRHEKLGDLNKSRYYDIEKNFLKYPDPEMYLLKINSLKKDEYTQFVSLLKKIKEQRAEEQKKVEILRKSEEERINKLKIAKIKEQALNKDFYDLTLSEAKIIGKEEEWIKKAHYIQRLLAKYLPVIPKGRKNYYYIYSTLKGIKKGEETLNMYIEMLYKYKGMTYDEVMDDMKKSKKITK